MSSAAVAESATRPIRVNAEVVENRDESGGHWRLLLRVPGWPGFAPGQFVMLSAGAVGEVLRCDPLLPRPMAVYRARECRSVQKDRGIGEAEVEILYQKVGRGTRLLAEVLPGQRVGMVGPLGRAFPALADPGQAILVGGGTGIASLYELAARVEDRRRLRVILGARTADLLMGRADFADLQLDLRITTEDGSAGRQGLVTESLESALGEEGAATVYACGPTAMMRRCAEIAAAHQARCTVSLENVMACGFGVCLGCAVPRVSGGYALVCKQGPVMDAALVDWENIA